MNPLADLGDVFASPGWTVGATVLAAVAIAVTVYLYRKQRSRKELSFRLSGSELVSIHSEARDSIEIRYRGLEIESAHLLEVELRNSGNVAIKREDFERPVALVLGEGVEVLTMNTPHVKPPELDPEITAGVVGFEGSMRVQLEPLLLNPGDEVTVQVLVSDFAGEPDLDYRIVGIAQLRDAAQQGRRSWRQIANSTGLTLVAAVGSILFAGFALGLGLGGREEKDDPVVQVLGGQPRCARILKSSGHYLVIEERGSAKRATGSARSAPGHPRRALLRLCGPARTKVSPP